MVDRGDKMFFPLGYFPTSLVTPFVGKKGETPAPAAGWPPAAPAAGSRLVSGGLTSDGLTSGGACGAPIGRRAVDPAAPVAGLWRADAGRAGNNMRYVHTQVTYAFTVRRAVNGTLHSLLSYLARRWHSRDACCPTFVLSRRNHRKPSCIAASDVHVAVFYLFLFYGSDGRFEQDINKNEKKRKGKAMEGEGARRGSL